MSKGRDGSPLSLAFPTGRGRVAGTELDTEDRATKFHQFDAVILILFCGFESWLESMSGADSLLPFSIVIGVEVTSNVGCRARLLDDCLQILARPNSFSLNVTFETLVDMRCHVKVTISCTVDIKWPSVQPWL